MFSNPYMQEAYKLACRACEHNEIPIGCVIIHEGKIIGSSHNLVERHQNPLAHAEIIALEKARTSLNTRYLEKCDLYVTLEPCPMCAHAISLARINRVYFGALDEKSGGVLNGPKIYNSGSCHHKPEVINGIMEKECTEIIRKFFLQLRKSSFQ